MQNETEQNIVKGYHKLKYPEYAFNEHTQKREFQQKVTMSMNRMEDNKIIELLSNNFNITQDEVFKILDLHFKKINKGA
jgi:hypothetical protein